MSVVSAAPFLRARKEIRDGKMQKMSVAPVFVHRVHKDVVNFMSKHKKKLSMSLC